MSINTIAGADINRLLNEEVDPVLRNQVNRRTRERKLFNVETKPVSGKYFLSKAVVGGNFRLEGRPEGGYLPGQNPDARFKDKFAKLRTMEVRFPRRLAYTGVDVSGVMRAAPKTATGGFENLAALVLKDTVDNIPEMISRRFAGGQAGIVGRIASINSNVVTLAAANGPTTAAASYPWAGNRLIREGMVLDAVNGGSAYNALRSADTGNRGRPVDAVGSDGISPTITMEDIATANAGGANAWAANDLLVEFNTRQEGAVDAQSEFEDGLYNPMGILDAVQDGSDGVYSNSYYGNLAVSSYRSLQSHKINNTNNTGLTVDMLNRLYELIAMDSLGGGEPDMLYCTPSIYRSFSKFLTITAGSTPSTENPRRYQQAGDGPDVVGTNGVVVAVLGSMGRKTIVTSPFAPHYRLYAVAKETMMLLQEKEPGFMNDDGLTLRQVPGKDEWVANWKWYCTGLVNLHPRRSGYITGLNGDHNN